MQLSEKEIENFIYDGYNKSYELLTNRGLDFFEHKMILIKQTKFVKRNRSMQNTTYANTSSASE